MNTMKKILLLVLFCAASAQAQGLNYNGQPQLEDNPANDHAPVAPLGCKRVDTNTAQTSTDGDMSLAVCDQYGQLKAAMSIGSGATDIGKAEDSAHTTGDVGVPMFGIAQNNTPAPTSATVGDYVLPAISTVSGALQVSVIQAYQSSAGGGLLRNEDVAAANADTGVPILGVIQATPTADAADGDYEFPKLTALGKAWGASDYPEDLALSSADPLAVVGSKRNDTVSAGAFAGTSGDAANISSDIHDRVYVNPWGADESEWTSGITAAITDTTRTPVLAATGSASLAWCLTAINCTNSSATATLVTVEDGTTAKWKLMLPAGGSDGQTFATPIKGTDNTAWNVSPVTTGTSTICAMTAFKC